jgi:hypothetical protein
VYPVLVRRVDRAEQVEAHDQHGAGQVSRRVGPDRYHDSRLRLVVPLTKCEPSDDLGAVVDDDVSARCQRLCEGPRAYFLLTI